MASRPRPPQDGGRTPAGRRRRSRWSARASVPLQAGLARGLRAADTWRSPRWRCPTIQDQTQKWGRKLRHIIGTAPRRAMRICFSPGSLGFNTDAAEVFGSLDTTLLLATVLLVLVLLGAIYRSPLIALIPLVVVGVAYTAAQGLIYLYAKTGATVSQNATQILVVLMFGVGTDYCLLLVSRYREELHRTRTSTTRWKRAHPRRAGDPRQRPDRHAGDARPARRGRRVDSHPRARRGDRRLHVHARGADAAARAPHDRRTPRLLAATAPDRLRAGRRDRRVEGAVATRR